MATGTRTHLLHRHTHLHWRSAASSHITLWSLFPSSRCGKSRSSLRHTCRLCYTNWVSNRHCSLDKSVQTVPTSLCSLVAAQTEQICWEKCGGGSCWEKNEQLFTCELLRIVRSIAAERGGWEVGVIVSESEVNCICIHLTTETNQNKDYASKPLVLQAQVQLLFIFFATTRICVTVKKVCLITWLKTQKKGRRNNSFALIKHNSVLSLT